MKRDPDLVRQLLIFFDAKSSPDLVKIPSIEGYDVLTIKYHGVLLYDAGFLRCEPVTSSTSTRVIEVWPFELTWAGHEFLDTAPDNARWRSVVSVAKEKGGAIPFTVIGQLLVEAAKAAVGL